MTYEGHFFFQNIANLMQIPKMQKKKKKKNRNKRFLIFKITKFEFETNLIWLRMMKK